MRPLATLQPGESARITQVRGEAEVRHRLLEMGLTLGTQVRLVRVAPLGDPVELQLRGYRLSVRKAEAAVVTVEGT
ncbi:MAG: ferrous iron transport protein A [Phycisphaerae bacterium]